MTAATIVNGIAAMVLGALLGVTVLVAIDHLRRTRNQKGG